MLSALAGGVFVFLKGHSALQEFTAGMNSINTDNGIQEEGMVEIGGLSQWVSIRGADKNNPLLIWLHGGPGEAYNFASSSYQQPWEDFFTVVNYDQRGAGKSRPQKGVDLTGVMSLEYFLDDIVEIIEHAKQRTDADTVIVLGHSWGTALGAIISDRRPDLIDAYIGVGNIIAFNVDHRTSVLRAEATRRNDVEGLKHLEQVGPMPIASEFETFDAYSVALNDWFAGTAVLIHRYGGSIRGMEDLQTVYEGMAVMAFMSPNWSLAEVANLFSSGPFDVNDYAELQQDIHDLDLTQHLDWKFEMPVILINGFHDLQTPTEPVERLFEEIEAPYKSFTILPNAAHMPMSTRPGIFLDLVVREVREALQIKPDASLNTNRVRSLPSREDTALETPGRDR